MIYKKLSFFSVITVLILIAGCKGDTGPAGPSQTGSITGFVTLINSDGSLPANRSGVVVSIQGTSLSTMTDSLGQWTISNVTTGTYTIAATKPNYGMTEQQGVQFLGGSNPLYLGNINGSINGYMTLAQPPNFTVAFDSLKIAGDSELNIWFSMSGQLLPPANEFLIAIGNDSNVNGSDPQKYLYSNVGQFGEGENGFVPINASDLYYAGFKSGATAYLVAYPLEFFGFGEYYSMYYDIPSGRYVYTSLGAPTKVIRITIP
jgi:Carboxypeptidase regulatory-like domain